MIRGLVLAAAAAAALAATGPAAALDQSKLDAGIRVGAALDHSYEAGRKVFIVAPPVYAVKVKRRVYVAPVYVAPVYKVKRVKYRYVY